MQLPLAPLGPAFAVPLAPLGPAFAVPLDIWRVFLLNRMSVTQIVRFSSLNKKLYQGVYENRSFWWGVVKRDLTQDPGHIEHPRSVVKTFYECCIDANIASQLETALMYGYEQFIYRHYHELVPKRPDDAIALARHALANDAAENGQFEIYCFLTRDRDTCLSREMQSAAKSGNLELLKYIVDRRRQSPPASLGPANTVPPASLGPVDAVPPASLGPANTVPPDSDEIQESFVTIFSEYNSNVLTIASYLLERGATVNGENADRETAMDHALGTSLKYVKFLLDHGARLPDDALEIAAESFLDSSQGIIDFLRERGYR